MQIGVLSHKACTTEESSPIHCICPCACTNLESVAMYVEGWVSIAMHLPELRGDLAKGRANPPEKAPSLHTKDPKLTNNTINLRQHITTNITLTLV